MRDFLPTRYQAPIPPKKFDQVVLVNWLNIEVDRLAPLKMPILSRISGYRNREVFAFLQATGDEFWSRWLS
ncbi:MAG: hypothetical protein ACLPKB_17955 [Xanthobacteraceae bacterium]